MYIIAVNVYTSLIIALLVNLDTRYSMNRAFNVMSKIVRIVHLLIIASGVYQDSIKFQGYAKLMNAM